MAHRFERFFLKTGAGVAGVGIGVAALGARSN
jgi:hypothetical protein